MNKKVIFADGIRFCNPPAERRRKSSNTAEQCACYYATTRFSYDIQLNATVD